MNAVVIILWICAWIGLVQSQDYKTEDLFVPDECDSVVKSGDHLLLEYEVIFKNGTRGSQLKRPSQLFHVIVDPTVRT